VVEKVFGGLYAFGGEHLRYARTDAAHIHYRSIQASHMKDGNWPNGGAPNRSEWMGEIEAMKPGALC
jgi:hypothetical protein